MFLNNNKGYTLAELLVSASIIALMSTVAVANYGNYGKAKKLQMAAQVLASDVRIAQSYAMSQKRFAGTIPPGGWGIYASRLNPNNTSYIIFADTGAPNRDYDVGEEMRTVNFTDGVTISNIQIDGNPRNGTVIIFEPPGPVTWICRLPNPCPAVRDGNAVDITLSMAGGATRTVRINAFGLVDVN